MREYRVGGGIVRVFTAALMLAGRSKSGCQEIENNRIDNSHFGKMFRKRIKAHRSSPSKTLRASSFNVPLTKQKNSIFETVNHLSDAKELFTNGYYRIAKTNKILTIPDQTLFI